MNRIRKYIQAIEAKHPHYYYTGIGVVIVIAIDILYSIAITTFIDKNDRSTFGDFHNAINTFFTGLALVFVVYGVYVQHKEKKERDREKTQEDFEKRLFQMIDMHERIIETMECDYILIDESGNERGTEKYAKRAVINKFKLDLFIALNHDGHITFPKKIDLRVMKSHLSLTYDCAKTYERLYATYQDSMGNYFRMLYQIFKFIDKANIDTEEKIRYAKLVRAKLSNNEVFILMLNGISHWGKDFIELIQNYSLLKHLPSEYDIKDFGIYKNSKAFGEMAETIQKTKE